MCFLVLILDDILEKNFHLLRPKKSKVSFENIIENNSEKAFFVLKVFLERNFARSFSRKILSVYSQYFSLINHNNFQVTYGYTPFCSDLYAETCKCTICHKISFWGSCTCPKCKNVQCYIKYLFYTHGGRHPYDF